MKRRYLFLFIFVLVFSGCANKSNVEDNKDAFHYNATYSTLMNSLATMSNIAAVKEGVLLFTSVSEGMQDNTFTVHYNNEKVSIVNADISNKCDFNNAEGCSSTFDKSIFNMYVYGDKLYYYIDTSDVDADLNQVEIRVRNIDGTDDKALITEQMENTNEEGMQAFNFTIHQNKIYYIVDAKVYCYDLSNNKKSVLCELDKESSSHQMFFHNEFVFISTDYMEYEDKIYNYPILKVSLANGDVSVWMDGIDPYYISEDFIIYLDQNSQLSTYFYDLKEDKKIKLMEDAAIGVYIDDSYIVVPEIMMSKIYLYNVKGELLDVYEHDGSGLPQGIIQNAFYISSKNRFTKVDIEDNKFQNVEVINFE